MGEWDYRTRIILVPHLLSMKLGLSSHMQREENDGQKVVIGTFGLPTNLKNTFLKYRYFIGKQRSRIDYANRGNLYSNVSMYRYVMKPATSYF
jgi:hypothetical protein